MKRAALERMTSRSPAEKGDHDPGTPLRSVNREVYAQARAAGAGMTESARLAGASVETAKRYWEDPEGPTGRVVLARIAHLQQVATSLLVPSAGTMLHEMLATASEARAAGKYDVAAKIYTKLYDQLDGADDGAIPTVGEDVSNDDLEGKLR